MCVHDDALDELAAAVNVARSLATPFHGAPNPPSRRSIPACYKEFLITVQQ